MREPTLSEKIGLALERREKTPEKVRRCTTHHHACACREYEFERAKARIEAALEVYAGMEGFIPETAAEGYCLRIIEQMNKALQEPNHE